MSGRYNGLDANIASLKSQILGAEYNLAQTVVRAPSVWLRYPAIGAAGDDRGTSALQAGAGVYSQQKRQVVAVFARTRVLRLTAGDSAEVVFNGLPGSVYSGKRYRKCCRRSRMALPGQRCAARAERRSRKRGHLCADRPRSPPGSGTFTGRVSAQAAVYTDYFAHVSIMRKVLLRMTSWLHYLYLDRLIRMARSRPGRLAYTSWIRRAGRPER
ncbi:hypothetical protein LNO81_20280 [Klebsiella variicola subsp. variicola]|nr:hypothetical protein [Klebsiella variicola subsp. variicola]